MAHRTRDKRNVAENSHDNHPISFHDCQDDRYVARFGDRWNEDRGKGVENPQQHSPGHSARHSQQHSWGHSVRHPRQYSPRHSVGPSQAHKDSQGLLPEERCEISSGGGALIVVNTWTSKKTTYRVAQQHIVSPQRKENVNAALGAKRQHSPDKC